MPTNSIDCNVLWKAEDAPNWSKKKETKQHLMLIEIQPHNTQTRLTRQQPTYAIAR